MASLIKTEKTGYSKLTVVNIKSATPYSDVDKILVYTGIKRKVNSLLAKLPIVNKPTFLKSFLYLLFTFKPPS